MENLRPELKSFARRIRLLNMWRGISIGTLAGCLGALVWAILDYLRVAYATVPALLIVIGIGLVLGAIVGFFLPVSELAMAISIDRRAHLKDRLTTSFDSDPNSKFGEAQKENAVSSLTGVKPSALYPMKFGPFQFAALVGIVVSIGMFLLGNSPAVRGPKSEGEKAELKEIGQKVERVAKPLEKPVKSLYVPASQKQIGSEMNRFAKEMQEGKLNKEEAMRKANDIASKAEAESKSRADEAQKKSEEAETALGKYQKIKLDESGIDPGDLERTQLSAEEQSSLNRIMEDKGFENTKSKFSDIERKESGISETAEKISQLSKSQQDALRAEVSKRQEELQKEIDRIDKLPPEERKKLEQQRQEMVKQQQQMQKISEALKMSEETKKALKELMESADMQKIRETLEKMKQNSSNMKQGQPPSKEDIEALQKQLDQLEQALKDPQLRKQIMDKMKEAMKQLESGQMSAEAMQQMMSAMGMGNQSGNEDPSGDPGTGNSDQFADTGKINKSKNEMETKGKGTPTNVRGQWDDTKGEQWSVTVKAPTQVGNRTTVPYRQVMPKYRKSAEKALATGKIPKEKEKRVRDYFGSLNGGN